jgi:hypothetical protein
MGTFALILLIQLSCSQDIFGLDSTQAHVQYPRNTMDMLQLHLKRLENL